MRRTVTEASWTVLRVNRRIGISLCVPHYVEQFVTLMHIESSRRTILIRVQMEEVGRLHSLPIRPPS